MGRAFKEQISWLTRAWDGWSEAEQVVALYSVARKLGPVPTRFLQILLAYNFPLDGSDILMTEARANDPAWVSHICESSGDGGTADLLQHLPLLRPSNGEAKAQYLALIPKVLSHALSQGSSEPLALEKARQLLSYSLIHPALSIEERRALGSWLKALEEKLSQGNEPQHTDACNDHKDDDRRLSDSCSHCTFNEGDYVKPQWNETPAPPTSLHSKEECRWSLLDVPHSPNNSGTSSRSSESESINEDNVQSVAHPGMRDIGVWLKSLRLHKYSPLLCNLRYEELLALNEEMLEAKGVTKGARHKIILSIAKLKDRSKQLESIEKDLMNGGSITTALNQLKQVALTPMLPSKCQIKPQDDTNAPIPQDSSLQITSPENSISEPDLPSQFTRVMGKVCTHLLVCAKPDDEAMSSFLSLVERCVHHEAFTSAHSKRFLSWKQQILRIWHPLPPRGKETRHVRRWSQQYSDLNRSARFNQHRYSNSGLLTTSVGGNCLQAHLTPPPNPYYNIQAPIGPLLTPRNSLPGVTTLGTASLLSPLHFLAKRPSLQETPSQLRPHVTLQRTRSAPSRPHQLPLLNQSRGGTSTHLAPDRQVMPGSHHNEAYSCWTGRETPSQKSLHPSSEEPPPGGGGPYEVAESDLTNRLESLCLSMTEHALG